MKNLFRISVFPLVALATGFIFPLVMAIIVLFHQNEFKNLGLTRFCAISTLLILPIILFIPFGLSLVLDK